MTDIINIYHWLSPFGELTLEDQGSGLSHIYFGFININNAVIRKDKFTPIIQQLTEYANGQRKMFDLALDLQATPFQLSVYNALSAIPWGKTQSYSDIARAINHPKACRAVGLANNKNPLPIIIPCHRIIGKNKKLTGYAGGLNLKRQLLELEECEYV